MSSHTQTNPVIVDDEQQRRIDKALDNFICTINSRERLEQLIIQPITDGQHSMLFIMTPEKKITFYDATDDHWCIYTGAFEALPEVLRDLWVVRYGDTLLN